MLIKRTYLTMTTAMIIGKICTFKTLIALDPMSPQSLTGKGRTTEPCVKQKSKLPIICLFPDQISYSYSKPHVKPAHIHASHSPNISASSSTVQASLKQCMSQTALRRELSQTKLPPVTTLIQEKDIVAINGEFQEDNPGVIHQTA